MKGYKAQKLGKAFKMIGCTGCKYIGRRYEFYGKNSPSATIGFCPKCKKEVPI